ncbi:MAG: UDP-N-acetyl-D-mannosamine dehydrogenase, partial [Thermoprotei archaeon]
MLRRGELKVTVLGLGRIGLPTAVMFARAGAYVAGLDVDQGVVDSVN